MSEQVRIDGNIVEIDGRWRMELPGSVRVQYQERKAGEKSDHLALYVDSRKIADCCLERNEDEQADTRQLIQWSTTAFLNIAEKEYESELKIVVRDNARMAVCMSLNMSGNGESLFGIIVVEKQPTEIVTRIQFKIPCVIENLIQVMHMIYGGDYHVYADGRHPFGNEWEQYWRMVMYIASSIALIDEIDEQIDFGPSVSLDGGISIQLPVEINPIAVMDEDERNFYLPTDGVPTQDDLERRVTFLYYIFHRRITVAGIADDAPDRESRILQMRRFYKIFQFQQDRYTSVLCENVCPEGYKAVFSRPTEVAGFVFDVIATTGNGIIYLWEPISRFIKTPEEMKQISMGIYDRIKFANSSGEMIPVADLCVSDDDLFSNLPETKTFPLAYPRVSDEYYEHFTLVSSDSYTTRRDADFVGKPIRALMEEAGTTYEDAYDMMEKLDDTYSLDDDAREFAKVFRLDKSLFDPYEDTEAMIRIGMFSDVRMFHALRSLAWTLSTYAEREGRPLSDYRFEELEKIGKFIERKEYLNYTTESHCSGLCSHCDWRVFYVPDAYIGSDCERSTDLRNLCGKENRSGNVSFVSIPGLGIGNPRDMHNLNRLINRNEETLESLEALREDLQKLLPVMKAIHDGFMADRNRTEKLEGPLADALTAWCALAVAAKEPFYSEEASDQPETNAGLKEPLARPDDDLPASGSTSNSARRTSGKRAKAVASKPAARRPSGDVLDLGGATVIVPNQFEGNMTLRNVVIPEGVTEIGQGAFNSCMFLETISFPKSLRRIDNFAFMSCRNLKRVEFAEGIEELGDHAFGATNNLKEVHFPDSLKKVAYNVFGIGGDSPYATAYLSGELAKRLYDNSEKLFCGINARHLVIDGKPYDSVEGYISSAGIPSSGHSPSNNGGTNAIGQRAGEYRADMEAACRAGKSIQQMIDAARKAIAQNTYADRDAFESAVQSLDRNAAITFGGKHFVLSGFGGNEQEVSDEIEKRGGIIHSSMVKMADYLVVCLDAPGAAKVKKALEWRKKGAKNQIVSDYQLWQAILGTVPVAPGEAPKAREAAQKGKPVATKTSAAAQQAGPSRTRQQGHSAQQTAPTQALPAQPPVRKYGWIGSILPEGIDQAQAERELEEMSDEDAANLIDTMRQMKELEEQIARIKVMADQALKEQEERKRQEAEEQARQEQARREREEAERRRIEAQKAAERVRIQKEISDLSQEMASLTGLFAGIKRRKLQKRIDELNDQLRKL